MKKVGKWGKCVREGVYYVGSMVCSVLGCSELDFTANKQNVQFSTALTEIFWLLVYRSAET